MRSALLAVLVLLGASGCATYVAPIARTVRRGEIELYVAGAVSQRKTSALVVDVKRVPPGTRLLGASFGTGGWHDDNPCLRYPRAAGFRRAPARPAGEPLHAGERLSLDMPGVISELADDNPRLLLWLETESGGQRCVPFALASPGEELPIEVREHFTFGLGMRVEALVNRLGPAVGLITFPVAFGMWIDRMHVEVGAGPGFTTCPNKDCPFDREQGEDEDSTDTSFGATLFAGAELALHEVGDTAFGLGLRYRLDHLTVDQYEDHETRFWMHGPVVTPYIGAASGMIRPGRVGARILQFAFEIPVGYAFAGKHGQTVTAGVNLHGRFLAF